MANPVLSITTLLLLALGFVRDLGTLEQHSAVGTTHELTVLSDPHTSLNLVKRRVSERLRSHCVHPYMWRGQICNYAESIDFIWTICGLKDPGRVDVRVKYDDQGREIGVEPVPETAVFIEPDIESWPPTPDNTPGSGWRHGKPIDPNEIDPRVGMPKWQYREGRCPLNYACVNLYADNEGHVRVACDWWPHRPDDNDNTYFWPRPRYVVLQSLSMQISCSTEHTR